MCKCIMPVCTQRPEKDIRCPAFELSTYFLEMESLPRLIANKP